MRTFFTHVTIQEIPDGPKRRYDAYDIIKGDAELDATDYSAAKSALLYGEDVLMGKVLAIPGIRFQVVGEAIVDTFLPKDKNSFWNLYNEADAHKYCRLLNNNFSMYGLPMVHMDQRLNPGDVHRSYYLRFVAVNEQPPWTTDFTVLCLKSDHHERVLVVGNKTIRLFHNLADVRRWFYDLDGALTYEERSWSAPL